MIQLKRWLVALDRTELDETLVNYVNFISGLLKPEKIYFLHLLEKPEISEDAGNELLPVDEEIETTMQKEYAHRFTDKDIELSFEVREGNPFTATLKYYKDKKIDLVMVGRKHETRGSGMLPQRLARKVPGSIIFIPDTARPQLNHILVPTDFSDNSLEATEEALLLARNLNHNVVIHFQHIYSVPTGYYYGGKSYEEFAAIMKGHAEKDYAKFLSKLDTAGVDTRIHYTLMEDENNNELINQLAEEIPADMIVMGARGKTDVAAMLLGSTTEKLLRINLSVPKLIVKKKGDRMGLLDAIMNI
ncbi:MAG: universal stress protein [Bacteroidia bacterium]